MRAKSVCGDFAEDFSLTGNRASGTVEILPQISVRTVCKMLAFLFADLLDNTMKSCENLMPFSPGAMPCRAPFYFC